MKNLETEQGQKNLLTLVNFFYDNTKKSWQTKGGKYMFLFTAKGKQAMNDLQKVMDSATINQILVFVYAKRQFASELGIL
jgi:hypothetical protein